MLRWTGAALRRGKPRPRAGMFPDKYRRVPAALKPQQGGQQFFSDFLIRDANDALLGADDSHLRENQGDSGIHARFPEMDLPRSMQSATEGAIAEEMKAVVEQDGFYAQRSFNERQWYEQERDRRQAAAHATSTAEASGLPPRVLGNDYFKHNFGYSLVKDDSRERAPVTNYSELELWGEMPRYHRDTIFLYLISRRRNTYAVAYNYEGKRLLTTYTAGNRGLKGGDRGFRGDGSSDNGHQVTSMYLNDLLPKVREARAASGRPLARNEKIELVVRVMGFYNGRQGAVRAVQDRSQEFTVRYLEDITPFPLNGPKMPRGVFR